MISSFIQDAQDCFFDDEQAVSLNLDLLKGINLDKYPPNRLHFLINALQRGIKPPSGCSMRRSERRNQRKSGVQLANELMGKAKGLKSKFRIPTKFGVKPLISPSRNQNAKYLRKKTFYIVTSSTQSNTGLVSLSGKPVKSKLFDLSIKPKVKTRSHRVPKQKVIHFKVRSPKWLQLRAQRDKFRLQVQNYRQKLKSIKSLQKSKSVKKSPQKNENIPLYFRKKKASQQRRRKQKHILIRNNRDALVKIFGDAIFKKGWPVSRKDIKIALGIKQQETDPQYVGEFLEMIQLRKVTESSTNRINALQPKKGQISRMVRIVRTNNSKPLSPIKSYTLGQPQKSYGFPSLLGSRPNQRWQKQQKKKKW